ncbi:MAG: DUF721 domain-containing protein [Bacillota bacterium]|nr:DUF721 domain-containing protein [Bacillota bacterium]
MMLPLKDVLEKSMDKMGYTARIRAASAMQVWNNEIAPSLAVASRATFVRGKTLYITVEKPVWAQQLSMMKRGLVRRINASAGGDAIRDIRFRSGQVRGPLIWGSDSEAGMEFHVTPSQEEGVPDWTRMTPDEDDLAAARDTASLIGDSDIRDKFCDLMVADAKWRAWIRKNLSPAAVEAARILKKEPWLNDSHVRTMVPGASSDDLLRARDVAACELRSEISSLAALDRLESGARSKAGAQPEPGDSRRVKIKVLVESLAMLVTGAPPQRIDAELVEHALGSEYASYLHDVREGLS